MNPSKFILNSIQDCKMILNYCIRPFLQILELIKTIGLVSTFNEIFYLNREAIVTEKDLRSLKPMSHSLSESNSEIIEINKNNFEKLHLKYTLRSRYLKALSNLNKGYESFAIVRGNEVLGDVWYATSANSKQTSIHPDIKWLGIDFGGKDVYAYDVYVKTEERENLLSVSLYSATLHRFREKGFVKVYGYAWADNTPSLFLSKLFRFKELKRVKLHRLLFIRK